MIGNMQQHLYPVPVIYQSPVKKLVLMVVSNLDGNFVYFAFTYSSTFLTAALTYCDELKSHDLALLSSSTFITCAHGNIFVGPIDLLTPRSSCVSGLYTLCSNFNIIQKYITDDHMLTSSHIFQG